MGMVERPKGNWPREVLRAAIEQLTLTGHTEAAEALEEWRAVRYPPRPRQHRWDHYFLRKSEEGYLREKECRVCGLEEQYRPVGEDGKWRGAWVWPDGRVEQRSTTPTPPCPGEEEA